MHLLNCEHPKRVFNPHTKSFVWVRCNECNACRNAKAAKWTRAIEDERKMHRYSLFVTLTFDNNHLPQIDFGSWEGQVLNEDSTLVASHDNMVFRYADFELLFQDKDDRTLFDSFIKYGGLPYCSTKVIQDFLKRLNKYIYDHITFKFKNFRYFICSEYGSTTFRPHYHGIFFVDDREVAERFEECILHCWKRGRIDCQFVEKSAGAYVAQYVNKSACLPLFYKKGAIRQRFYFSRQPTIGTCDKSAETLQEIIDKGIISQVSEYKGQLVSVPLESSVQNRLFPKCFSYFSLSDTARIALYTINRRFSAKNPRDLKNKLLNFCKNPISYDETQEADACLVSKISDLVKDDLVTGGISVFNFVRRLYYVSRHFLLNALRFEYTEFQYYIRLLKYWSHKELFSLRQFYDFQDKHSRYDSDSLVLMYPEFCYQNFGINCIEKVINMFRPVELLTWFKDSESLHISNLTTHFKNGYIDSKILQSDNPFIYKLLKNYFYAKKCYEVGQAFAT